MTELRVFRPQMKQQQSVLEVQLTPFNILLRAVLGQLQDKDQYSIFAQPVSVKEVRPHNTTRVAPPQSRGAVAAITRIIQKGLTAAERCEFCDTTVRPFRPPTPLGGAVFIYKNTQELYQMQSDLCWRVFDTIKDGCHLLPLYRRPLTAASHLSSFNDC